MKKKNNQTLSRGKNRREFIAKRHENKLPPARNLESRNINEKPIPRIHEWSLESRSSCLKSIDSSLNDSKVPNEIERRENVKNRGRRSVKLRRKESDVGAKICVRSRDHLKSVYMYVWWSIVTSTIPLRCLNERYSKTIATIAEAGWRLDHHVRYRLSAKTISSNYILIRLHLSV